MNTSLKHLLLSLHFSSKEADIYLVLLHIGKTTVSEIARQSNINRTTCYDILDTLISYKLIRITGKKPKQEYIAESPEKIISLLEQRKINLEKQIKQVKQKLPELKSIHNINDRPKVRFYEGIKGLQEVYEDTLTSHETIRAYATVDDMHNTLPKYFSKYYHRRSKKGIHIRAIIPNTQIGKERATKDIFESRKTALIPPDKYYFSPEINIYDNKIMIASWREKLGIIIESEEIADAMKKIYELAWAEAKRLDKKIKTNKKT